MQTRNPENSVLDLKPSHVLNFPLTVKQQLWLIFLAPAIIASTIYIVDLSTDLSIGIQLISESHIWAGALTLVIIYIPPLICYVRQLSNPPPENEFKVLFVWFLIETGALILFPLRPIYCFGERLFWAIEALRLEDPNREEALVAYEHTRSFTVENYLFFQGITHAGPQAILQLTLIIMGTSSNLHTEQIQALGALTSLLSLAMISMSYQRYETQARGGRKRVWLRMEDLADNNEEPQILLAIPGSTDDEIPKKLQWTKVMDEDDPIGKLLSFLFWFLFLFGRCLALILAAMFFPWAVFGICAAHYIFTFLYILPSPNCKKSIIIKVLLSFLYIFCLVEVGIQFRKSSLFYGLFFIFSVVENFCLTLLWVLWAKWDGWWYHYSLYLLGITHCLAIFFASLYMKFFKPPIRRLKPTG